MSADANVGVDSLPRNLPERTSNCVRLLLVGDVVGKPGMRIACEAVNWLRRELQVDGLIANAENAADGSGLRCKDYRRLIVAGYDAITLGDHVYRKREIMETLETQANIVRPCNLPAAAPGKTNIVVTLRDQVQVAIVSALGRVFMKPIDCPFRAVESELASIDDEIRIRLIDFHAEATSDKQLMGRFLDGRVSVVLGTHTHVATADQQILPGGSGYHSDVGMTGPFESILGRKIAAVMEATLDSIPLPFQVATNDVRLNGTWCDIDIYSGKCMAIGRIELYDQPLARYNAAQTAQRKVL
ncbi:MAG: TIGR00282 family metallophosphoesterase [Pirellulaceae bacterium]